jgi:hypothetical protein
MRCNYIKVNTRPQKAPSGPIYARLKDNFLIERSVISKSVFLTKPSNVIFLDAEWPKWFDSIERVWFEYPGPINIARLKVRGLI